MSLSSLHTTIVRRVREGQSKLSIDFRDFPLVTTKTSATQPDARNQCSTFSLLYLSFQFLQIRNCSRARHGIIVPHLLQSIWCHWRDHRTHPFHCVLACVSIMVIYIVAIKEKKKTSIFVDCIIIFLFFCFWFLAVLYFLVRVQNWEYYTLCELWIVLWSTLSEITRKKKLCIFFFRFYDYDYAFSTVVTCVF